jgi:polysaccharide export outer membrane protein
VKKSIYLLFCVFMLSPAVAPAQTATRPPTAPARTPTAAAAVIPPTPKDYIIGVEDVLSVVFWREKDLSADVIVRPDGKISLPMLNDIAAAGVTPEQLADTLQKAATKFVREPGATVIVKEIRSRKVFVIGQVTKPGTFTLTSDMNVLQIIAEAGGFLEDAKKDQVTIVRTENGQERRFRFNYDDVVRGKRSQQNLRLLPGDTVIVR